MKRVFTDDRFPGVEVVNYGDTKFFGVKEGKAIHEFQAYERDSEEVSESFAQRRAQAYFDRLAEHQECPVVEFVTETESADVETVPAQIVSQLLAD